jgi:hypothetical protein
MTVDGLDKGSPRSQVRKPWIAPRISEIPMGRTGQEEGSPTPIPTPS